MSEPSTWQRLCPLAEWRDPVLEAIERELARPETDAELAACETAREYPRGVIARLRRVGLASLLAEEDGASPAESRVTAYHFGALCALAARQNASLAVTLGINGLALLPAYIAGTDDQLRAIFRRVHAGSFAALLLTELDHGSNLLATETRAEPGTLVDGRFTPARDAATHYRVRGEKNLINGATEHDLRFVLARTHEDSSDAALAAASFSVLWVDAANVEPLPRWRTLPVGAADISGARFDGVVVPAANVIGRDGDGMAIVQKTLAISRGGITTFAAGSSCRGYELALDYAKTRAIYGEPILRLGAIADHLIRFEALDLLVAALATKAVSFVNAIGPAATHYTTAAKLACCALAEEGVVEGRYVLGARSLLAALPYEAVVRDVVVYGIFDGTSHVMLDQLQRQLAKLATREAPAGRDWLDTLRAVYATPPRRLVESARHRAPPVVEPIDRAARALAGLAGGVALEPIVVLAEALHAVVRALRDAGRWDADQGLRFQCGAICAGVEAILAAGELADGDRRAALGLALHAGGSRAARQPAVVRFAVGWYGARMCGELRRVALAAGLEPPPPLDAAERALARDAGAARDALRPLLHAL